uniref:ZP domain-containing protein n=1 Tax=Steinernema glaseri TaxID=37863 RepID=A0A1I7Z966_9BILA
MPVCRYEILEGGPHGAPVKFAVIGQQVYHQWKCESETTETFCMLVHSCKVDDERGTSVPMLDADGCSLDKYVLNNLEYPEDLTAGQEAHVFKFADRPALFFQCQIAITLKEPATECPRPSCKAPERVRRAITGPPMELSFDNSVDVVSQTIEAIETFCETPTLQSLESAGLTPHLTVSAHCFGISSFGIVILCLVALFLGAITGVSLKRT